MNKEIKYLLEEMEDNTQDYVGTNGCLYQDLLREELNLLLDYISNLQKQVKKQKEVINKAMSILEDNFVYDYVRSCDTTDGVGYYEIDTGHFTYRVYELLKEVSE